MNIPDIQYEILTHMNSPIDVEQFCKITKSHTEYCRYYKSDIMKRILKRHEFPIDVYQKYPTVQQQYSFLYRLYQKFPTLANQGIQKIKDVIQNSIQKIAKRIHKKKGYSIAPSSEYDYVIYDLTEYYLYDEELTYNEHSPKAVEFSQDIQRYIKRNPDKFV